MHVAAALKALTFGCCCSLLPQAFCYECLPPLVANLAMNERIRFINFKEALKQVEFLSASTRSNAELAKWAFNVVYTRSVGQEEGEPRIAPMADMVRIYAGCYSR